MSSAPTAAHPVPPLVPGAATPLPTRLRLKPTAPTTGHADGAWWPRSRDLPGELTRLLAALADRLGRIERVSYHLGDWQSAPRRIEVGGLVVRLAGYRAQHPDTIDVLSAGQRLTLLVVPPQTPAPAAHRALMLAAHPGNADPIPVLLAASSIAPQVVDGGRVHGDR